MKAMAKEADVKTNIRNMLAELGPACWYFMPVPTGMGVQGVPDFVCCIHGVFVGIEAKFGRGKQSDWQEIQEKRIGDAKGLYLLINEKNVATLPTVLRGISALGG